ncbi:hypothetical protein ACLMJK_003654 [Lecanora helva]
MIFFVPLLPVWWLLTHLATSQLVSELSDGQVIIPGTSTPRVTTLGTGTARKSASRTGVFGTGITGTGITGTRAPGSSISAYSQTRLSGKFSSSFPTGVAGTDATTPSAPVPSFATLQGGIEVKHPTSMITAISGSDTSVPGTRTLGAPLTPGTSKFYPTTTPKISPVSSNSGFRQTQDVESIKPSIKSVQMGTGLSKGSMQTPGFIPVSTGATSMAAVSGTQPIAVSSESSNVLIGSNTISISTSGDLAASSRGLDQPSPSSSLPNEAAGAPLPEETVIKSDLSESILSQTFSAAIFSSLMNVKTPQTISTTLYLGSTTSIVPLVVGSGGLAWVVPSHASQEPILPPPSAPPAPIADFGTPTAKPQLSENSQTSLVPPNSVDSTGTSVSALAQISPVSTQSSDSEWIIEAPLPTITTTTHPIIMTSFTASIHKDSHSDNKKGARPHPIFWHPHCFVKMTLLRKMEDPLLGAAGYWVLSFDGGHPDTVPPDPKTMSVTSIGTPSGDAGASITSQS